MVTLAGKKDGVEEDRWRPWTKLGSKPAVQDFSQVCLITLCLQSGTVRCGYQFVFILCWAVSNDVKTTCQFNTKDISWFIGDTHLLLDTVETEKLGAGLPSPLPGFPPATSSAFTVLCYLIARCERSHQRETWWVNRVALPLTVIWSALSLTMGPTTAEAYTILYETHCTWIYLLLVYGWMRILIKVIIRSVPIIGVCSLSPPLSSKH